MAYGSFEELDIWKSAKDIAVTVYRVLADCRDYGLKDQMTRAAVCTVSNIAEGAERGSNAEFVWFLHYAKGSSAELRTQASIAQEIFVLDHATASRLICDLKALSKKIHALVSYLQKAQ